MLQYHISAKPMCANNIRRRSGGEPDLSVLTPPTRRRRIRGVSAAAGPVPTPTPHPPPPTHTIATV